MRVSVHYADRGLLALDKPAGAVVDAHPLDEGCPSLVTGMAAQAGKGELENLDVKTPYRIFHLDSELSGLALVACNKKAAAYFRNLYGSYKMVLTFQFLSRSTGDVLDEEDVFVCDLPLASHSDKPKEVLVSHKTGKQAHTEFKRLERMGQWSLWEASTRYLRRHQVRVHAMECGLGISGETLYTDTPLVYLSQLKRRYVGRENETSLYPSMALHVSKIDIEVDSGEPIALECPLPRKFSVMLDKLREAV